MERLSGFYATRRTVTITLKTMKPQHFFSAAVLAGLLAWAAAQAQQTPHVGYVFPAGGRQGTQFDVRVGGQFLDGVTQAHISGPGIQVKVVELVKPMTQQQANQLRDKLKALTSRLPGAAGALSRQAGKASDKLPSPRERGRG